MNKGSAASVKREGRSLLVSALVGFLVGAAVVAFLLWRDREPTARPAQPAASAGPAPVPAPGSPRNTPPPAVTPAEMRSWPAIPAPPAGDRAGDLAERGLLVPVQGVGRAALRDTFGETRGDGTRAHEALDILAPRGTPVLAVEGGTVRKLFSSERGGLTLYQFDPSETYVYYYAHLDRYADGLAEGQELTKGQVLGFVGSTGNAAPDAPHLHFAIFRLTPEKQWWKGDPINPFEVLRGLR